MIELPKKAAPPSAWVWCLVTLLWGTVFFATSTWMLSIAAGWTGEGSFDTGFGESLKAYACYVPVLIAIALAAMSLKQLTDPGSLKQIARHQAVAKGQRERYFVSFAGSIASGFLFTFATAAMHIVTVPLTGAVVHLTLRTVAIAGGLNIVAGLAASVLVAVLFMVARSVRGAGR